MSHWFEYTVRYEARRARKGETSWEEIETTKMECERATNLAKELKTSPGPNIRNVELIRKLCILLMLQEDDDEVSDLL